ncbi:MAG: UbiA family prenyltransferase [Candidatus Marinimicrobia bacterium]|nr:UbiA family prenyltransferase [Candidatus Neomarinimicrobiota bacterium]
MRHQLVYPVILSISISMYYGINFHTFSKTIYAYLPVFIIYISFFLSEIFLVKKKTFLILNLILIISSLAYVVLSRFYGYSLVSTYFSSMLFCVFFATYLAVFESWRIVSYTFNHGGENYSKDEEKGKNYYYATQLGIAISLILLPIGFIFSTYGIIFLLGFILHSLTSFYYWNMQGKTPQNISKSDWIPQKLFFGFTIIAIIVLDTFNTIQPESSIMAGFISFGGFAVLLATYLAILSFSNDIKKSEDNGKSIFDRMVIFYKNNPFRIVTLLSFIFCFIFLIVKDISSFGDISTRINYVYLVFSLYLILGIIYEIVKPNKKNKPVSSTSISLFLGIFKLTRFFVSFFIYLIIAIPLLLNGHGIFDSLFIPIPILLAVMGGFSLNDYFDYYRDLVNKPYRAIPTGKLTKEMALKLSAGLLTLSICFSIIISNSLFQLLLYFLSIAGVIFYNYIVNKFAYSKTIFTSLLCNIPFFLLINILDYPNIYLFLPIGGIFFIIGRELLMDILDFDGDIKSNIRTIPILIGIQKTKYIAFLLQFVGLALIIPLILYRQDNILFIVTIILLIIYMFMIISWHLFNNRRRLSIIKLMWVQMLASILFLI